MTSIWIAKRFQAQKKPNNNMETIYFIQLTNGAEKHKNNAVVLCACVHNDCAHAEKRGFLRFWVPSAGDMCRSLSKTVFFSHAVRKKHRRNPLFWTRFFPYNINSIFASTGMPQWTAATEWYVFCAESSYFCPFWSMCCIQIPYLPSLISFS